MNQRSASSWTVADIPDQSGRVAVVTGANAGLGLEITRVLAAHGATVVMACRNLAKAEAAAEGLWQENPAADVEIRELDLADLGSVRRFADGLAADRPRVDLLVNNAGLMAVDEGRTADGFETQFGVNHLGHYALTARLLPLLNRAPAARVASMSSFGHRPGRMHFDDLMLTGRYRRWPAYFQSKLANLLFTAELQRRLEAAGERTIAVAAHPGGSATDLGHEGRGVTNAVIRRTAPWFGQPVADGALPMLRAVTDPAVRGGEYYGPRWVVAGREVRREVPSRRARDTAVAARLWTESARLSGVEPLVTPATAS
jgi:protochlorophyllide reductase